MRSISAKIKLSLLIFLNLWYVQAYAQSGFTCCDQISDFEGNQYNTVLISNHCWMSENLKSTHYANGTALEDGTGVGDVSGEIISKYYFDFNDNPSNTIIHGKLYTWAAVMNGVVGSNAILGNVQGICPTSWHVPVDEEWKILEGNVDSNFGYPNVEWDVYSW